MKKLMTSIFLAALFIIGNNVYAADNLKDAVDEIWIEQYPWLCENVMTYYEQTMERYENGIRNDEGYQHLWTTDYDSKIYSEIQHRKKVSMPILEKGYRFWNLTQEYSVQYAQTGNIEYLLEECWLVPIVAQSYKTNENRWYLFDKTAEHCINNRLYNLMNSSYPVIPAAEYDFVKDTESLEKMLEDAGAEGFVDFKVIDINSVESVLYFKYTNGEYGIVIREEPHNRNVPALELKKVYSFDYILQKIGETELMPIGGQEVYTADMLDTKNTYETEALALQKAGLLQGNEKGLDLLKPLTRIEAAALLIRALGLEEQTVNYTESGFSDVASDNWGAPYAALAKAKGITNGISDTEFAPEQKVTSDQFATFALRAIGESDFDYTEGTEILVNQGIITEEQAEKMDLFTRGDMAKIVYEMREHGMM